MKHRFAVGIASLLLAVLVSACRAAAPDGAQVGQWKTWVLSSATAIAGTAAAILASWFPADEANLKAMAAELGQSRLSMGANYRSDIDAGLALGQAVAQKALARAASDNSNGVWTGTVPTGPGLWVPAAGTTPLEPPEGQRKPWLPRPADRITPG